MRCCRGPQWRRWRVRPCCAPFPQTDSKTGCAYRAPDSGAAPAHRENRRCFPPVHPACGRSRGRRVCAKRPWPRIPPAYPRQNTRTPRGLRAIRQIPIPPKERTTRDRPMWRAPHPACTSSAPCRLRRAGAGKSLSIETGRGCGADSWPGLLLRA